MKGVCVGVYWACFSVSKQRHIAPYVCFSALHLESYRARAAWLCARMIDSNDVRYE